MTPPPTRPRRRARTALGASALAACTLLGTATIARPASAALVNIPGCGQFDLDPSIYYVYSAWSGPTGQLRCPTSNTGATPDRKALYAHFQNGSIYWKQATAGRSPYVVLDPIRDRWARMGWESSLLGYPMGDTYPIYNAAGQLGVANEFEGGTLAYSPSTGAHEVHGQIREKWRSMGVAKLGFPTSDELDFTEGGKVSFFERGAIYWWPDTNALPILGDITVSYTGLVAFAETDWDQGSNSDEPYAVLGAVTPTASTTKRSSIYSDVDGGESRKQKIQLYRGRPDGISLTTLLMEHDSGDPNKYRDIVAGAVAVASTKLVESVAGIPVAGPYVAAVAAPVLVKLAPTIINSVNGLLNSGDDKLGLATINLSAKQMVVLAIASASSSKGVPFKVQTGDLKGGGSRYRVYFTVEVV